MVVSGNYRMRYCSVFFQKFFSLHSPSFDIIVLAKQNGVTALTNAASIGHAHVVKLLLAHSDIDANLQNEVSYQLPYSLFISYQFLFILLL